MRTKQRDAKILLGQLAFSLVVAVQCAVADSQSSEASISNSSASSVLAEPSYTGHFTLSEAQPELAQSLLQSIARDQLWEQPDLDTYSTGQPTGLDKLVWAGSEVTDSVTFSDPILHVSKGAASNAGTNSGGDFTLSFHISNNKIIVTSSAPSDPRFADGFEFPFSRFASFVKFIPGADDTGYALILPRIEDSSFFSFAVCPRNRQTQAHTFTDSGYKVVALDTTIRASVLAKQRTGQAEGETQVIIETTDNLARSVTVENHIRSTDPVIDIDYVPQNNEPATQMAKLPFAAIRLTGNFTAPTKAFHQKIITEFMRIVPLTITSPVKFYQDHAVYTLIGSNCFGIFRDRATSQSFKSP